MSRLLTAALVTILAACAAEDVAPVEYGEGLGTPENPIPEDNATYTVVSRVELSADVPAPVADAVAGMRAFSTNPAKTILASADQAAVQALKTEIGTALSDRLEGYINTEVDKARIATKTLRQYATDLVAIGETSLTKFHLESSLSMTAAKTTHILSHVNFRPLALDIVVPIGGAVADVETQHPALTVAEAGVMTLGDQKFGIAFGTHAWSGINLASEAMYSGGVQTALVGGMGCAAVAKAVAAKCYGTACVGHEGQLRAICEAGGAAVVSAFQTKVAAFKLELFRFASGTAKLVDDNRDGLADRIIEGTWNAELNVGSGVRTTTTLFTASR